MKEAPHPRLNPNRLTLKSGQEIYVSEKLPDIHRVNKWVYVDGQPYRKVVCHFGDATLMAALGSCQNPHTASIVVDPNASVVGLPLLVELAENELTFSGCKSKDLRTGYFSLLHTIADDPPIKYEQIKQAYINLLPKAGDLHSLYLVTANIEDLTFPQRVFDEVTFYYPSRTEPVFSALVAAGYALKPGGKFILATEKNTSVFNVFLSWVNNSKYIVECNRNKPSDITASPLTPYHIIHGQPNYQSLILNNVDGRLGEYLSNQAQSCSGQIRRFFFD